MISEIISDVFKRIGHTWKTDRGLIAPSEDDVTAVLDRASAVMYDKADEDQYEQGGIIVQKNGAGYDTYVYVGTYY